MTDFLRDPQMSDSLELLTEKCTDWAMSQQLFADKLSDECGLEKPLTQRDLELRWRTAFLASHLYDCNMYLGKSMTLTVVCQVGTEVLPSGIHALAATQAVELPGSDKIKGIDVGYRGTYTINRFGNLGWNIRRIYDLNCDITDEDDDTPGVEMEVLTVDDEISFRPAAQSDEQRAKQLEDLFTTFEEQGHVESARKVLDAVLENKFPEFDVSSMFPAEIANNILGNT